MSRSLELQRAPGLEGIASVQDGNNPKFDLCSHKGSGAVQSCCASTGFGFRDAKRDRQLQALTEKWSASEKIAFLKLKERFQRYVETSGEEAEQIGTASGMLVR